MQYLLLVVAVFCNFIQNVFQKQYNINVGEIKNANFAYNFIMAASSLILMCIVALFGFTFHPETLKYSSFFAAGYVFTIIFLFLSIKEGSLSLTALMSSFSLIIPTLYGIIFLKETLSVVGIIGLVSVFVSLILINSYKKGEKISFKWLIYVLLMFIGNGCGATIQKIHQLHFPNAYQNEFMLFAMIIVSAVMLVILLIKRPGDMKTIIKKGGIYASLTGLSNGITNLMMLLLASMLPASILYPIVSGAGIVLIFFVSLIFYHERLSVLQYIGYFLGLASVILLSL